MTQPITFRLPKQQSTPCACYDRVRFSVKPGPARFEPVHPEEALRDSLEGRVFLRFMVNVDGSVSDVRVLRVIGPEVFRQAALDAVSQYRFKPAEHNGKIVPVWMVMPITFRLE